MHLLKLTIKRQVCKQTLPPSSQVSLSPHESNDRPAKRSPNYPNPMRRTLRREHTKISIMATTNALSVQRRSRGIREVFGPAELAGPCSISAVSRNGLPTRAQPRLASRPRTVRCHLQGNGGVQAATCPKMSYPRTSTVGARRSSTPRPCQDCRPSRADKRVLDPESCQRAVLTLAQLPVMLDLAHLVA
jgi:hypothetical protein